jgi:hypothetical protein
VSIFSGDMMFKKIIILVFLLFIGSCSTRGLYIYHDFSPKNKNIGVINYLTDNVHFSYGKERNYSATMWYRRYTFPDNQWHIYKSISNNFLSKLKIGQSSIHDVTHINPLIWDKYRFVDDWHNEDKIINQLASLDELKDFDYVIILKEGKVILPGTSNGSVLGDILAKRVSGYGLISSDRFNFAYIAVNVYVVDLKIRKTVAYTSSQHSVPLEFSREPTPTEISKIYKDIKENVFDSKVIGEVDEIFSDFSKNEKTQLTDKQKQRLIKIYKDYALFDESSADYYYSEFTNMLYPKSITFDLAKKLFAERNELFGGKFAELSTAVIEDLSFSFNNFTNKF